MYGNNAEPICHKYKTTFLLVENQSTKRQNQINLISQTEFVKGKWSSHSDFKMETAQYRKNDFCQEFHMARLDYVTCHDSINAITASLH